MCNPLLKYKSNLYKFKQINITELIDILENEEESYDVFLGFYKCKYCREFSKILYHYSKNTNINFYYVDRSDYSVDHNLYDKIVNELKIEVYPSMIQFRKGGRFRVLVGSKDKVDEIKF